MFLLKLPPDFVLHIVRFKIYVAHSQGRTGRNVVVVLGLEVGVIDLYGVLAVTKFACTLGSSLTYFSLLYIYIIQCTTQMICRDSVYQFFP